MLLQMFFGGFDVLNGTGLEPLALMRQAGQAVLPERLVPENFHRKSSVGSIGQDARMHDPNAGNDVGRFPFMPINRVAAFDKQMVFALVMPDGFGFGLREEEKVHIRVIPVAGQAIQRAFRFIHPEDVAIDGEEGITPQKRKRLFQSATRFQRFGLG